MNKTISTLQNGLEISDGMIQTIRKLLLRGYNVSNSVCSKKPLPHERILELRDLIDGGVGAIQKRVLTKFMILPKFKSNAKVIASFVDAKFVGTAAQKKDVSKRLLLLSMLSAVVGSDQVFSCLTERDNSNEMIFLDLTSLDKTVAMAMLSEVGEGETSEIVVSKVFSFLADHDIESDSVMEQFSLMMS